MIAIVKKLLKYFMKKNYKKQINKDLGLKKSLKKGNKLFVKWKGYYDSFNRWIDKKDLTE